MIKNKQEKKRVKKVASWFKKHLKNCPHKLTHPHAKMNDFRTSGKQYKSFPTFLVILWHFFENFWKQPCFERRSADNLKTHSLSLACSHVWIKFSFAHFILDFLNLISNPSYPFFSVEPVLISYQCLWNMKWEVWCVTLGGYVYIDDDCV